MGLIHFDSECPYIDILSYLTDFASSSDFEAFFNFDAFFRRLAIRNVFLVGFVLLSAADATMTENTKL